MAETKLPSKQELETRYNISSKPIQPEKKEPLQPIIANPVVRKKKSLGKRFAEMLIGDDVQDIGQYILRTAIVPTIQNIICDIPQLIFFRRASPRSGYGWPSDPRGTYTNYSKLSFSQDPTRQTDMYGRPIQEQKNYMFDEIIFRTPEEASMIQTNMLDIIQLYGYVTVAQVNEMMRVKPSFTDYDWGWRNIASSSIQKVREGYLLNLPKVIYLK